ncbi:DUF4173 domain-containing protein [Dokdonia sinensis]|uniref:DUF4173 domain-containing protein n=1 Tax=Dokdonia sinensis TaxID=2479847 RepID=A0A3M0FUD1_9FLAO|nr:DUF4173 domain-containing protein [Dokdonia sinensis]RMB56261.1 DUF4173 domain-containing protein [Dokdonia sinensis]
MKKNLIHLPLALLFSTLFYDQDFGLNMLLFAIIAVALVVVSKPSIRSRRDFIFSASLYVLSGIFVFTVNSGLAQFNYFIAFLVFAGSISGRGNSVYVQWFNGMYQSTIGVLHAHIHRDKNIAPPKQKKDIGFILLTTVVVVIICVLFASLYGIANPIFGKWLDAIDLSFFNFPWFILAVMGYVLLRNLTAPAELDIITTIDRNASLHLKEELLAESQKSRLQKEALLGTILLGALNGLILLFILADVMYLAQNPLEDAVVLSATVHEGVNALVTSIIIAITIILILFRGNLNFYKKSATLRTLTYVWLGLNILIVLLTTYKNFLYSTGFGLTYKRIGVFVYLLFCVVGMVTTYLKIARKHNLLFMFKTNARVAFVVLILLASFSWTRSITHFNLGTVKNPDIPYLISLGPDNGDLLYAFAKAYPSKSLDRDRIEREYHSWKFKLDEETWQSKTLQGILNSQNKTYEIVGTSY